MSLRGDGLGLGVEVRLCPALVAGAVAVVTTTDRTPVGLTAFTETRSLLAAQASLPALLAAGGGGGDVHLGRGDVPIVVGSPAVAVLSPGLEVEQGELPGDVRCPRLPPLAVVTVLAAAARDSRG